MSGAQPTSRPRRAALHTLGCRLNQAETAVLAAEFSRRGYELVPFEAPADVVVINSCSVTSSSEADCRQAVRRALRRSPGAYVAVTGCYAQVGAQTLASLPGVDLVVGTQDKLRLPVLLDEEDPLAKRDQTRVVWQKPIRSDFVQPTPGLFNEHTRAALKIQDGCDVGCSFCIIPRSRGGARSRVFENVLFEARSLLDHGHRELVLTGVNLGSYTQGGRSFADLLRALDALPGLERLRISSIEPSTVTTDVLRILSKSPRICAHLHVPVQSGDDTVLSRMHRPYDRSDLERLVDEIRTHLPDVGLGTDVMVGFPGEDDTAFGRTVDLLETGGFTYLHVFTYSERPGTRAIRLEGAVPPPVARERNRVLRELDGRLRQRFGNRLRGRPLRVLFEKRGRDEAWSGLTDRFVRVAVPSSDDLANQIHFVELDRSLGSRWLARLAPPRAMQRESSPKGDDLCSLP